MSLVRIDKNPTTTVLRRFGYVALIVFGLLAWWFWRGGGVFGFQPGLIGAGIMGALALWGVTGTFVNPKLNKPLFLGLSYVTAPIGFVLSYVVSGVLWFLVATPTGLIMKLCGKDPMERRYDPQAKSYWTKRDQPRSPESYFRQF